MKKRRELLWLSASTAALLVFSFTAGFGLRELYALARDGSRLSLRAGAATAVGRLIASRTGVGADPDMGPPQLYAEVLDRLRTLYVDKLPENTLLSYSSIEQMLSTLDDPNTRLLLPNEAAALKQAEAGHFSGLGAVLTVKRFPSPDHQSMEKDLTVVTPLPGSPAEAAHLLPGDRIAEVDGHWLAPVHLWTREMAFATDHYNRADSQWRRDAESGADPEGGERPQATPEQRKQAQDAAEKLAERWRSSTDLQTALELLLTSTSGDHTLTIERAGEPKPHQVKVTFGTLEVASVPKPRILPGNIGHLQLRQISPESVAAVASALKELHDGGAQTLVLDLRHSPGGSLEAAQQIAGLFVSSGPVAFLQERDDHRKMVEKPLPIKPASTAPPRFASIAVLVDGGTAGSSEVLAAALRDRGVAKLFGSTTFGDGTEQTIMPLDNGAAVSVTSAKFLTPKHVDFDGKGLKPDVAVPASPGLDRQLEQAVKSLRA